MGDAIVIGADIDTTGPAAEYNSKTKEGIELAVAMVNRAGGVLDRPLELVIANSESDPAKAPTAYNSLIDQGAISVVGYVTAGIAPVKSIIQETQLLTIAAGSTSESLVQDAPSDYLYGLLPVAESYIETMCAAFEAAGVSDVALFHDDAPGVAILVESYRNGFLDACLPNGFVAEESAALDASDFTAPVSRISAAAPDAVLTVSIGGVFQAQSESTFAQLMPEIPRFSIGSFDSQPDSWAVAQVGALEGLVAVHPVTDSNPRTVRLQENLRDFMGDADLQTTQMHALGYDSVMLVVEALERAGVADDPAALNSAFQQTSGYAAALGQADFTFSFSSDKHVGSDGACGLSLAMFDESNVLGNQWEGYQPNC